MTEVRIPVIRCMSSVRTWYFQCPYCWRIHVHEPRAGHHAARCQARVASPYKDTGYILQAGDRRARLRADRYARKCQAEKC